MIHPATAAIQQEFQKRCIKFRIVEQGDASAVEAGFSLEDGAFVVVRFLSLSDENDVAVRASGLLTAQPGQQASLCQPLNRRNREQRIIHFTRDDQNQVSAETDLFQHTDNVGEIAVEAFFRMMKGIQAAYPSLLGQA